MRNVLIILFMLLSCLPAVADQRGVSFEKDGLVYVIASETIVWTCDRNVGAWKIGNVGEVYVSGVTVSDSVVTIPPMVYYPSNFCRKDTTVEAEYRVLGIGENAFAGARLKKLVIPYGLRFFGNGAFRDLEITDGVLVVPPVRKMKANVFDGVKSKVLLLGVISYGAPLPVAEKTFDNTNLLPDFYVRHGDRNLIVTSLDRRLLYTIGRTVYSDWLRNAWGPIYSSSDLDFRYTYRNNRSFSLENYSFQTVLGDVRKTPKIVCKYKSHKRFARVGTDIDMMPPCEFACKNPYTNAMDVYDEFAMNESLFRCKKGAKYFYFALDGKPVTNVESLLDSSGRDPFGLQVRSEEEVKERNEAKQRETDLNKKVDDLKKVFGF